MTRNDQLLLQLAQGLSVGDAAKEDDHDAGAVGGFNHCTATLINTPAACWHSSDFAPLNWFPPPATLLDGTAEHTKAQVDAPEVRREPEAVRRTAEVGEVVPAATPVHPVRARRRPPRISHRTARITTIPVLAPLIHVAVHVIQTPRVRLLLTHGMGRIARVLVVPRVISQLGITVAKTVRRRRPSPARTLPLRLRR